MANVKIHVKLILQLRDAGMSRQAIASTRHICILVRSLLPGAVGISKIEWNTQLIFNFLIPGEFLSTISCK